MADDMGEKSEEPSSRKLSDAREQGQVAKSQDLAAAIDLFGAFILLLVFGASLARALFIITRSIFEDTLTPTEGSIYPIVQLILFHVGISLIPLLLALCLIAASGHVTQFGLLWNTGILAPKFTRLNPVTGMGRVFGKQGLVKTGINSVKLVVVVAISYLFLSGMVHKLIAAPMLSAYGGWMLIGSEVVKLAMWLFLIMLIMGIIDYILARRKHFKDLRMTKEEVKEERRSMEGDPKVKGKRMRMAREIIRQRLGASVPKADVIVTNPTHFSVAIAYDESSMKAPKVVAKGADEMAFTIRHIAKANKIPILERPPLARALFKHVEVGQEIRPEYYEAVAEVLAFIYRLDQEAKQRLTESREAREGRDSQVSRESAIAPTQGNGAEPVTAQAA